MQQLANLIKHELIDNFTSGRYYQKGYRCKSLNGIFKTSRN